MDQSLSEPEEFFEAGIGVYQFAQPMRAKCPLASANGEACPYQCGGWKGGSQGHSPETVTGVVHCQGDE